MTEHSSEYRLNVDGNLNLIKLDDVSWFCTLI